MQAPVRTIFVNASQHADGNTVRMGQRILGGVPHERLDLVDYRIDSLGQRSAGDQFELVEAAIRQADTIIFGTPVYWHTVSGSLKVLLERLSQGSSDLADKRLVFFFQGSGPTPESVAQMEYMMRRFAEVMGMRLVSIASDAVSVGQVNALLRGASQSLLDVQWRNYY